MRRREFLTLSAAAVGGHRLQAQIPLRFFREQEALIVAAATARIFPSDETGPGANEAGVVIYIDRQLAGPYGRDRYRYTQPPFEAGTPEHGYQGKATPREVYREGIANLPGFDRLAPAAQDAKLREIESTYFFHLLRQHTIEGMFSDPMHGGNANMVGWKLIGYPGPQMSWTDHVDRHRGEPFRPEPASLIQVVGHKVTPWEDEA
jgi:gluconate 2-dehydrogenase gamma chain